MRCLLYKSIGQYLRMSLFFFLDGHRFVGISCVLVWLFSAGRSLFQAFTLDTKQAEGLCTQLPLLHACICESMRNKPVGPVIIRQACDSVPILGAGAEYEMTLRKGDSIVVDLAAMGRNPELYPQPDSFDPIR